MSLNENAVIQGKQTNKPLMQIQYCYRLLMDLGRYDQICPLDGMCNRQ